MITRKLIPKKLHRCILGRFAARSYRRAFPGTLDLSILLVDPVSFGWLGIGLRDVLRECDDRNIRVDLFRPAPDLTRAELAPVDQALGAASRDSDASWDLDPFHRLALYPACIELELGRWEFDPTNPKQWQTLQAWVMRARALELALHQVITTKRPDVLLYAHGHHLPTAVARMIGVQNQIGTFAVENTFSGRHLVWDSVAGISVNRTLAPNYLWRYEPFVNQADADNWYQTFHDEYQQAKGQEHVSPPRPFPKPSGKKVILFLSQVYTDSSTFFGLPQTFHSQAVVLQQLRAICERNNWYLLAKLHPKESSGDDLLGRPLNHLTWRKAQAAFGGQPQTDAWSVDVDNRYDTVSMVDACDVAVTINSQSAIEATMRRKRVIACGHSFFGEFGFVDRAENWVSLEVLLQSALDSGFSEDRHRSVRRFLYLYFEKYCIQRSAANLIQAVRTAPYAR